MTPAEQDNELRALLGEMPYFVIDWLELSDDLRNEWKKGGKASDFGGHRTFIQKYEKKLADFITADRKRVELEARAATLDALDNHKKTLDYIVKDGAPRNHTNYEVYMRKAIEVDTKIAELIVQQEQL